MMLSPMAAYDALLSELEIWRAEGRRARFWWRDDDAVAPTPALTRLTSLAGKYQIPVALAVIPGKLAPALPGDLASHSLVTVLAHGFDHGNRAPSPEKKSEFPANRDPKEALRAIETGKNLLASAFGAQFLPVFVPPWNRMASAVGAGLRSIGFLGISAYAAKAEPQTGSDLPSFHTHVDPIDWQGGGRFAGEAAVITALLLQLKRQRAYPSPPFNVCGILTHHLRHDDGLWLFLEQLLACTSAHTAVHWLGMGDLLATPPS